MGYLVQVRTRKGTWIVVDEYASDITAVQVVAELVEQGTEPDDIRITLVY